MYLVPHAQKIIETALGRPISGSTSKIYQKRRKLRSRDLIFSFDLLPQAKQSKVLVTPKNWIFVASGKRGFETFESFGSAKIAIRKRNGSDRTELNGDYGDLAPLNIVCGRVNSEYLEEPSDMFKCFGSAAVIECEAVNDTFARKRVDVLVEGWEVENDV